MPPLTTLPATKLRMVLSCYVEHQAPQRPVPQTHPLFVKLRDHAWVPTPDDCPVPWDAVQTWYDGLQRTARTFMDSY
jgi:hypothetical protein